MIKKYDLIYRDLVSKINHGIYPPESYLPSENELVNLYHTSRETVRKALSLLNESGLIHKIQGKGSIVLASDKYAFPLSKMISYEELNELFEMKTQTKVLKLENQNVPQDTFKLDRDEIIPATYIQRLRIVDGEPLVIDNDYVLKSVVPEISNEVAERSLYKYFEKDLHLEIGYAIKEVTVEAASKEEQNILNISSKIPVVVVKSTTHLQDNTLLHFTKSVHRADKFKFVEHAKRNF